MDKYIGKGEGYEGISLASSIIDRRSNVIPFPNRKIVVKSVVCGKTVTIVTRKDVLEALRRYEAN